MAEVWLDITDIPAQGREFSFSDPSLWTDPIKEYGLPHGMSEDAPLAAEFMIIPEGRGALIRGTLKGAVITPCDRCADDARIEIDETFDLFEELPLEGEEVLEQALLRQRGKVLELNISGLLWEQFLLAMPVKPLCAPDCPGLCPGCGRKLGEGTCACEAEGGDPRLAALRNLKLAPKGGQ